MDVETAEEKRGRRPWDVNGRIIGVKDVQYAYLLVLDSSETNDKLNARVVKY